MATHEFVAATVGYRNPSWGRDNSCIDVEVDHPFYGWIGFSANPNDIEQYGRDLYARIIADGVEIAPYVEPEEPAEETPENP